MFETVPMGPPDAILGLTEAFKKDPRSEKINLGVGVYKDASGQTPIFKSVKEAEKRLLELETTKLYLPIQGSPEYGKAVQQMVFGAGHEIIALKRAVTAQAPGGTGALRVAAEFIKRHFPSASIWVSDPTWENHKALFTAAGIPVKAYPYYDEPGKCLAFDKMAETLETVSAGDVVLLHACCHNPTGMDPDIAQWRVICEIAKRRQFLPFFDFAYQGLGDGLEEDAAGLRTFCATGCEMLVASSFSKNFGLYNERVGALTLVAQTAEAADKAMSQIKICIRTLYSNPPSHGAAIVTTVLNDPALAEQWRGEVKEMCERINGMRHLFVKTLKDLGVARDFSFITKQRGMFSYSGLTKQQVDALRDTHAVYAVGSGRINVAAMTPTNMTPLCKAMAGVL